MAIRFLQSAEEDKVIRFEEKSEIGIWAKGIFAGLFILASWGVASSANAMIDEQIDPHRLVNVPIPEVTPHLGGLVTVEGRFFTDEPDVPDDEMVSWGPNIRVGLGILNRAEVGVEASSAFDSLDKFSGYLRVFLLKESKNLPALGVGILDLTTDDAPNIDVGFPAVAEGFHYLEPDKTNNSAYFVFAKHVPEIKGVPLKLRLYLGMGRGRFIGRCGIDKDLHGAFGAGELKYRKVRLIGEVDGRSIHSALGTCMPIYEGKGYEVAVNGMLQVKYLQNLRPNRDEQGLYPAIGVRLGVCVVPLKD